MADGIHAAVYLLRYFALSSEDLPSPVAEALKAVSIENMSFLLWRQNILLHLQLRLINPNRNIFIAVFTFLLEFYSSSQFICICIKSAKAEKELHHILKSHYFCLNRNQFKFPIP